MAHSTSASGPARGTAAAATRSGRSRGVGARPGCLLCCAAALGGARLPLCGLLSPQCWPRTGSHVRATAMPGSSTTQSSWGSRAGAAGCAELCGDGRRLALSTDAGPPLPGPTAGCQQLATPAPPARPPRPVPSSRSTPSAPAAAGALVPSALASEPLLPKPPEPSSDSWAEPWAATAPAPPWPATLRGTATAATPSTRSAGASSSSPVIAFRRASTSKPLMPSPARPLASPAWVATTRDETAAARPPASSSATPAGSEPEGPELEKSGATMQFITTDPVSNSAPTLPASSATWGSAVAAASSPCSPEACKAFQPAAWAKATTSASLGARSPAVASAGGAPPRCSSRSAASRTAGGTAAA
mmetsp:Transcript_89246/g.288967  ORF Transcript_89246/g.288967 Transcript_89246/m.288967 type:complete len:360 (+) Transcript_89246:323-1402(+)